VGVVSLFCHKENVKIAEVHSITSRFGHEDLVKTKMFILNLIKRARTKLSFTIKKLKYLN
jgi:hypothetical protein